MKEIRSAMKLWSALFALAMVGAAVLPAAARDFVQDNAGMLSASTVDQLSSRIGNFNARTGKEVVVVTVPSVEGGTLADVRNAAERAFAQDQVNGVLIFVDKGDRKDYIVPDRAATQSGWFTSETIASIRQSMESNFRAGDFDAGITSATSGVLSVYRSHLSSLGGSNSGRVATQPAYTTTASSGGHFSMFWLIVFIVIGFLVLRSIMRSMSGPRYGPGQMGGPGYGGPGYGAGPGYYGGGGGGFWSGLLGGLGGAWLGNELFSGRGGNVGGGGDWGGADVGAGGAAPDAGGWQSDAGQADMGSSSGGDWGGGGFGGGDAGGGFGGGDSGGGSW